MSASVIRAIARTEEEERTATDGDRHHGGKRGEDLGVIIGEELASEC